MATARTFTPGRFALTLDGVACGFVTAMDGGDVSADVVEEAIGPEFFVKKHIGAPKYEEFTAQIGLSLAQAVYDWIAATLDRSFVRKNGAVTTADGNSNAKAERQFFNALISEVQFPALDGASKDAAHLTVKFAPELTKSVKASGKVPTAAAAAKAKAWTRGNFRLELNGLDCSHVRSINAFTVRLSVATDDVGDARDVQREPGRLDFPNLRVMIAEGPGAATWETWFEDFVIKGNNDQAREKSGAIVYLAPDTKTELGRVVLHNVGIFALRRNPRASGADTIATLTAELYCERMELVVGKRAPVKPLVQPVQPVQPAQPIATPVRPLGIRR